MRILRDFGVVSLDGRGVLIDLSHRGLNIAVSGCLNASELRRGLLEGGGGLLRRVEDRRLVIRVGRLRAPLREALEQLIERRWNRAAGRDIKDILQRRQGGLELLELAEQDEK